MHNQHLTLCYFKPDENQEELGRDHWPGGVLISQHLAGRERSLIPHHHASIPWTITRLQLAKNPIVHGQPPHIPHTHRGAIIKYVGSGILHFQTQDLSDLHFSRGRFPRQVDVAIFFCGYPEGDHDDEPPERPDPHEQPAQPPPHRERNEKFYDEIDFPGTQIDRTIRFAVARMHRNLGHINNVELLKLLALNGIHSDQVVKAATALRCAACDRCVAPRAPNPAALPDQHIGQMGHRVQMDILYVKDFKATTIALRHLIDEATHLRTHVMRGSGHPGRLGPFGWPLCIRTDPDGSWGGDVADVLDSMGYQAAVQATFALNNMHVVWRKASPIIHNMQNQQAATNIQLHQHRYGRHPHPTSLSAWTTTVDLPQKRPFDALGPFSRPSCEPQRHRAQELLFATPPPLPDLPELECSARMDLKSEKVPAPLDTGPSLRTSLWCWSLDAHTGEIVFDQDLRHQRLRPPVLPAQRDIIREYWCVPQPGCHFTGVGAKDGHGPCYQAYMARTGADDASSPSSADGDVPPITRPRGKPLSRQEMWKDLQKTSRPLWRPCEKRKQARGNQPSHSGYRR